MVQADEKTTPMMKQWRACKDKAPSSLLFFRLGDFYEAFYEDAEKLSEAAAVSLTKRQDVPMAGVPVHAADGYIDKLVAKGHLVAIAEQMELPGDTKGIVKRDIARLISPGTTYQVKDARNNYFACLTKGSGLYALACLDLTTGELIAGEFESEHELLAELCKRAPKEILIDPKCRQIPLPDEIRMNLGAAHLFSNQAAIDFLCTHFAVQTLDGFGMKGLDVAIRSAGALLNYIKETLFLSINHIRAVKPLRSNEFLGIDRSTQLNLELEELFLLINKSSTAMGARLLHSWLMHPLCSLAPIQERHQAIGDILSSPENSRACVTNLRQVRDIERLITRIETGNVGPRDIKALGDSLTHLPQIKRAMEGFSSSLLTKLEIEPHQNMAELIGRAIIDAPPLKLSEGKFFKECFSADLDALYQLKNESASYLMNYQMKLREDLGIKTLKVSFTKAFGYYIEVSRAQAEKMPDQFERRQTLVNTQRFISPELKDYELKILTADEKIKALEAELFFDLKMNLAKSGGTLRHLAGELAHLDALLALAMVAKRQNYVAPTMHEGYEIEIEGGRHPMIENAEFVPNDTTLSHEESLMLITGPNMAGKSTYIRQVALIAILAQMGSYVPATKARLGLIDRVFSRIGAHDDLSRGQSTFMVEMTETAHILRYATKRSLVVLDEIGRGTSTYDGIAIAWAVAEHLAGIKTLFATHYAELNQLEGKLTGAINCNVAVAENADGIAFLHKIERGGTDKSYGIHVAKLAGLPAKTVQRAQEMLKELESKKEVSKIPNFSAPHAENKLEDHGVKEEVFQELEHLKLDEITPLQALQHLSLLQKTLCEG